jgi:hypothetical protein
VPKPAEETAAIRVLDRRLLERREPCAQRRDRDADDDHEHDGRPEHRHGEGIREDGEVDHADAQPSAGHE